MDLSHSEVLVRSGNPDHAPRFDIGDFPPLGGSSGMIMGKGELDAMGMGHGVGVGVGVDQSVLIQQAREKMKQEGGQGRMWWPNLLDIDGVGQDGGKNMHTSSDNPSSNLIQSNEDFPALPSLKRDPRADNNINNINMHARGIPHQRNLVDTKADLNGVAAQVSGPSKLLRSSFMHKQQESKVDGEGAADQYGLKGLLSVIRMTDPALNTLALGTDLTKLGLNLNSSDSLYASFAYPCAENASRREPDFVLPYCYYMQPPALKTSHLGKFELLTLFYIFYNMPKDTLQVYAAKELYNRDWRYHKELKMWFTRPSESAINQHGYERGSIIYFDINSWEQRVFRDAQLPGGPSKFMTEHELNTS